MLVREDVLRDRASGEASALDTAARLREVEPMVRAICRGRLGDVDGDDAAQRALLGVWRALASGREIESVWGYAAATARYEVAGSYEDAHRWPTPAGDLTEALWADDGPGPAEHAVRVDEVVHARERVEALLAQLSPRQAEVMRASVLAERSTADAAAELGITPNSVRSAQVRAMAHMREMCGTRSPNPLASDVPYSARRTHGGGVVKNDRAARVAAADSVISTQDSLYGDPLVRARAAVDALEVGAPRARDDGDGMQDPLVRAHAAVESMSAATDRSSGFEDDDVSAADSWPLGSGVEHGRDSIAGYGFDRTDHEGDADASGAA